jgi:hypothetical protein
LEQLRRGKNMDFASCFRMEFNMSKKFLSIHDFGEGVTAKLIEKRDPVWTPMEKATKEEVEMFFKSSGKGLELYNRLSFYDYPHKTLSALPTDHDIQRIIRGDASSNITGQLQTRKQVLEWVGQHWGGLDGKAMSEINIPKKNRLDAGEGRGKVGLLEKVESILERRTIESATGLEWK